jgi:hypothetical protein
MINTWERTLRSGCAVITKLMSVNRLFSPVVSFLSHVSQLELQFHLGLLPQVPEYLYLTSSYSQLCTRLPRKIAGFHTDLFRK